MRLCVLYLVRKDIIFGLSHNIPFLGMSRFISAFKYISLQHVVPINISFRGFNNNDDNGFAPLQYLALQKFFSQYHFSFYLY